MPAPTPQPRCRGRRSSGSSPTSRRSRCTMHAVPGEQVGLELYDRAGQPSDRFRDAARPAPRASISPLARHQSSARDPGKPGWRPCAGSAFGQLYPDEVGVSPACSGSARAGHRLRCVGTDTRGHRPPRRALTLLASRLRTVPRETADEEGGCRYCDHRIAGALRSHARDSPPVRLVAGDRCAVFTRACHLRPVGHAGRGLCDPSGRLGRTSDPSGRLLARCVTDPAGFRHVSTRARRQQGNSACP